MIPVGVMAPKWREFRSNWALYLSIHLAAGLLNAALLGPALSLVLGWFVMASGDAALTDQAILHAFLSPLGFVLFLVGIALVVTVSVFESAAILVAAHRLRRGQHVRLWRLGRLLAWYAKDIFGLALRMALKVVVLAAPFLALGGWTAMRLLGEFDINYYLGARPPEFWKAAAIIGALLLVLAVLLYRMLSGWVLALPLLLFGHGRPGEVLGQSRALVAPHRGAVLKVLLAWTVVVGVAFALSGLLLDAATTLSVRMAGTSLVALAWTMAGLFLAWSALNVLIGLYAAVSLMLAVLNLYERLAPEAPASAGSPLALLDSGRSWRVRGRWWVAAAAAAVLAAGVIVFQQLERLQPNPPPQVIAHRGASFDAPENTLASIGAAIEQGADWVEIDVQETATGEIVVIHDRDLMKLSGQPLGVRDTPLDQLRAVDIGSWKAPGFADQRVPLLSEVLELVHDRVRLNIELKYYGAEERLEERVAALVESHDMVDQVILMSLSLDGVKAMKQLRPTWTVGLLSSVAVGDVTRLESDFFAVNARFASRSFVQRAHGRDKAVYTWTVNDPAGMSAMMSKGVDGIITDRPALAKSVLAQRAELSPHERLLVLLASQLGSDFGSEP